MKRESPEYFKRNADNVVCIPDAAQKLIEKYRSLRIQGVVINCPYHINCGLRAKSRALVGKGRPEEIERVAEHYLKKYQMDAHGDQNRLRTYLLACGIGIDCSGFASWILNEITLEELHKPIWQCLTSPTRKRKLISMVRPLESISANLLTGSRNAKPVLDLRTVRPGDLIRLIHGGHVMMISEVGVDVSGKAVYFKYIQSTTSYGNQGGIDSGTVVITNPGGTLASQQWLDPIAYSDVLGKEEDTYVVRLHCMMQQT